MLWEELELYKKPFAEKEVRIPEGPVDPRCFRTLKALFDSPEGLSFQELKKKANWYTEDILSYLNLLRQLSYVHYWRGEYRLSKSGRRIARAILNAKLTPTRDEAVKVLDKLAEYGFAEKKDSSYIVNIPDKI